jgi:uncharacterized protein YegL
MSARKKSAKKPEPETLHVGLLLDESGSMCGNETAVIGGVNEFVEQLRHQEAESKVVATLGLFDRNGNEPVVRYAYAGIPLDEVAALGNGDYAPRGATPLNDAVVGVIRKIDEQHSKGDRVILVILTDGLENASETPSRKVRKLIQEKEAKGWEFIYLGANHDSWAESERIGIADRGKRFDFQASPHGTRAAMAHSAEKVKRWRSNEAAYRAEQADEGDVIDPDGTVRRERD